MTDQAKIRGVFERLEILVRKIQDVGNEDENGRVFALLETLASNIQDIEAQAHTRLQPRPSVSFGGFATEASTAPDARDVWFPAPPPFDARTKVWLPADPDSRGKVPPPQWLIPAGLRFVRILREGEPLGGKTYLLTFPLEITNKDYVARALKITELAMEQCIKSCLESKDGSSCLTRLEAGQDDIYYFCQHMLNPPAHLKYYEDKFGKRLSESNQVCLVERWFENRNPPEDLSLKIMLEFILKVRHKLMHESPGLSSAIRIPVVEKLIAFSRLMCSAVVQSKAINDALRRLDVQFLMHCEIRAKREPVTPNPPDAPGFERFWTVPEKVRSWQNCYALEMCEWDYFRRILGIASDGLEPVPPPMDERERRYFNDDLQQRLRAKSNQEIQRREGSKVTVLQCRNFFAHFDFDFSPEKHPGQQPPVITLGDCFGAVQEMLQKQATKEGLQGEIGRGCVALGKLETLFGQWNMHTQLNVERSKK